MKEIIDLCKVIFKGSFSIGKDSKKSKVIVTILLICCCTAFIPFATFAKDISSLLGEYGATLLLQLMIILMSIFVFVLSLVTSVSSLFFTKDNETIMALPIAPKSVFIARTLFSMMTGYLMTLLMFLPIGIGVGIGVNANAVYYIFLALAVLTLPILPSLLCSLIVLLVVRFLNIIKSKDAITYLSSLLGIGVAIAISFGMESLMPTVTDSIDAAALIDQYVSYLDKLVYFAPYAYPLIKMMTVGGSILTHIAFLLFIIGISALLFCIIAMVSEKLYYPALLKIGSYGSKGKKLQKGELKKKTKGSSITSALFKKELTIIFKTPIYVINFVVVTIFPLVGLIIGAVALMNTSPMQLSEIWTFVSKYGNLWILLIAALTCFMDLVAPVMYSKDGASATTMNYLPISFQQQFVVKVIASSIISLFTYVLAVVLAMYIFSLDIMTILFALISGILMILTIHAVGVFWDLTHPRIHWNTEVECAKQNLGIFVYMLLLIAYFVAGFFIKEYILIASIAIDAFIMIMLYKNESKYIDGLN